MLFKASGANKLSKKMRKRQAYIAKRHTPYSSPELEWSQPDASPEPKWKSCPLCLVSLGNKMTTLHSLGDWGFFMADPEEPERILICHKPTLQAFGWTYGVISAMKIVSLIASIDLHPNIEEPRLLKILYDLVVQGVDAGEFDFDTSAEFSDLYAQALNATGGPTVYYFPHAE